MSLCILNLVVKSEGDTQVARYRTKQLSNLAGVDSLKRSKLVTAVSEILRNSLCKASEAKVKFAVVEADKKQYLDVTVSDTGPGINNLDDVLNHPKYAGSGLRVSKRLVDRFFIESERDEGTKVSLQIRLNSSKRLADNWVTQKKTDGWIETLKAESPFSVVDDLEQENKQLLDSLAEIERYKEKLEERSEQLRRANQFKGEFLANMSHEIRTPMNAIIGMGNILERTELTAEQDKYLHLIKESGKSLLTIINDILDYSKIEAGKLEIEYVDLEPHDLVESTTELLATNAASKGVSLMPWVDSKLPVKLIGDPTRIRQILVNLTNNAIKFTSEGEIIVKSSLKEMTNKKCLVRFEVIDSGIGLTDEEQSKLFQPFVQADGSTTRKYGGTGLGLSICRQLVELMEGSIGVDSVKGVGSTFWFEVPFERLEGEDVLERDNLSFKKAAVVDDHPFTRELLMGYLKDWSIDSDSFKSGDIAIEELEKADSKSYDLILLDYMMPGISGLDFAKKLRTLGAHDKTKVVLLTAFSDDSLGEQAKEAGCDAFLPKPIRMGHLYCCLESLLQHGKQTQSITRPKYSDSKEKSKEANLAKPAQSSSKSEAVSDACVLLVEDNPTNQMVASIEIKTHGFTVDIANNGKEAVEKVSLNDYALVFMDCQMPVLDGYEATKEIRTHEARVGGHIPIVAMTANAMKGDREKCIAAGMDDYITKPFEPEKLKETIEKWTQSKLSGEPDSSSKESKGQSFDYEQLSKRFGEKQTSQLVAVFREDTDKRLVEVKQFLNEDDFSNISKQAHAIKGAASMIFAESLSSVAKDLELTAKNEPDKDTIEKLVADLCQEFESFKESLNAIALD